MALSYRQNIDYSRHLPKKEDTPKRSVPTGAKLRASRVPSSLYDEVRQGKLLVRVRTYLQRTGLRQSKFGRHVMGDSYFVDKAINGARWRCVTMDKLEKYLDEHEVHSDGSTGNG